MPACRFCSLNDLWKVDNRSPNGFVGRIKGHHRRGSGYYQKFVLVVVGKLILGQYTENSEKYVEVIETQTDLLVESLKSSEAVEDRFYPERRYFERDVYTFKEPHAQLYTIGLVLDPCMNNSHNCCMNRFGSPFYLRVKAHLVDFGYRPDGFENYHMLLAEPDEVLANVDVVDADGADTDTLERRRADDELFLDESCDGIRKGLGETAAVKFPYRLEPNGKLAKLSKFTHCQGSRLGHRPFTLKPHCFDNNATVNASASCYDADGNQFDNCVQFAYTQTAVIINCGSSGSANGKDFSEHEHCGTFLEIHRENGSPYHPEDYIISSRKIKTSITSGYVTSTMSLSYGFNQSRILCNYEESTLREGSMVFITDAAPECCCPPDYNNDKKIGRFFCPINAYDDTSGPYATKLSTLLHQISFNASVDVYPYCPTLAQNQDTMQCSLNDTIFGVSRVYNIECPAVEATNNSNDDSATYYNSEFLTGSSYTSRCVHWDACAGNPIRGGDWSDGPRVANIDDLTNEGCAQTCLGSGCNRDVRFTFAGHIGKVTCVPTDDLNCIDEGDDRFYEDEDYYLVSFNDNRTSYAFRKTDLVLHQPRANYQLWWVQRTPHNFIIQKKKGFRVSEPTCTFDAVNNRYFPYTMIDTDGSFVDTYYGG